MAFANASVRSLYFFSAFVNSVVVGSKKESGSSMSRRLIGRLLRGARNNLASCSSNTLRAISSGDILLPSAAGVVVAAAELLGAIGVGVDDEASEDGTDVVAVDNNGFVDVVVAVPVLGDGTWSEDISRKAV